MNSVRVPCPDCGPTYVPATHVVLTVSDGGASYLFRCTCGGRFYRNCSKHIAELLEEVAVVERIELEEHDGPPLTYDDLLDVAVAMRAENFLDELIS